MFSPQWVQDQGASERRGILWRWRGPSGLCWVWRNRRGPHLEGKQEPQASSPFRREPGRAPPRHAHGDLTSLAPHERLPEILVVPRCPLLSDRTGPAVRETRPRRTVVPSSASRQARVRIPRRGRLPAPPPTSRIKRGLYSGSTLDNDSISLTPLSSARREASPGVQPPTYGGRARPPPGGHRDKVNDSANIRAMV